jgi:FixJ family two-component response regulator
LPFDFAPISGSSSLPLLYQSIIALPFAADYFLANEAKEEKPKVVAIVDDDELIRDALHGLMKAAGFRAFAFASAEEFLNSGEQERTACLIADIRMPGMSGLELQSKLNKDHYRIPIIFITAHGDEKMRMQALRAGAVEFLIKPFDDEALLDSVRAALET